MYKIIFYLFNLNVYNFTCFVLKFFLLKLDEKTIEQSEQGWLPVYADKEKRLGLISIGFLLNSKSDAVR